MVHSAIQPFSVFSDRFSFLEAYQSSITPTLHNQRTEREIHEQFMNPPMRSLLYKTVAVLSVLLPRTAFSQSSVEIGGRVTTADGTPIGSATVVLEQLNRATRTDDAGKYRFTDVPYGRYTISVRHLGFVSTARSIVVSGPTADVNFSMASGAIRIEPVNVTATREAISPLETPLATSTLSAEQIHAEGGISVAHAVAQLPGVRSVTSGQQIGKPMVRGLFGPRILVLADGSRMEDYSWSDEDGPSIDARLSQRIEVIRGPASVLYGSEALGGVVNVISADLPFSADGSKQQRTGAEVYGGSNNIELGSALMAEGSQSKYGWRGQATGRFAQNFNTPNGTLQNSSFWAFNGEGALGVRQHAGSTTIRAAHYGGEFHLLEASGPEPGDSEGGPVRQTLDDRIQVTTERFARGMRLEAKAQWQRHSLAEVSDDCQPVPPATTCTKVKDQQAFGLVLNTGTLDLLAHHSIGSIIHGTIGTSGMLQLNGVSGPIFLAPDATTTAFAGFAFEQATLGNVTLLGGVRGDARHLSADASPALSRPADTRDWSAATADGGIVVRLTDNLAAVANYGTGWRAPTLFDLYTNGPNNADARYEIGDPTLTIEQSRNTDGALRWESARLRAEATVFHNDVDNFIYNSPTGTTISGLQVYRHKQTDAKLDGAELSINGDLADQLSARASYDFVNASDRVTGAYLPFIPPPRLIAGANLHGLWSRGPSFGVEVEHHDRQTRLAANDFAPPAYTLLNLEAEMDRVVARRPVTFSLDIRNALNTSYTDFLSRYKGFATGPGMNLVLRATTGAW